MKEQKTIINLVKFFFTKKHLKVPVFTHKVEKTLAGHLAIVVIYNFSAGVGRTGVFIALSIALERMQYEGIVDIFQTIRIMRTQRPAMVQTEVSENYQIYEWAWRENG